MTMTREELINSKGSVRIIFSCFAECEEIIRVLNEYEVGFFDDLSTLTTDGIKRYLREQGSAYICIDSVKQLCYGGIDYKNDDHKVDINYFDFLSIMKISSNSFPSNEHCTCNSPDIKKVFVTEWFDFCRICKKERK